ncbi:MAG: CtsR family transcriptional regulator [Oscillospiraceae bacterium]|jgi:transcriptional regulator CtsR
MGTSDRIADFILGILEDEGGSAELQRSILAEKFRCVPSQINYVISTRFSPEHGYLVESRRGGNGYIRITRVQATPKALIMHTVNAVGDELSPRTAAAFVSNLLGEEALDERSAALILTAVGDNALRPIAPEHRDIVRASIFKQMLVSVLADTEGNE